MNNTLKDIQYKVNKSTLYEFNGRVIQVTESLIQAEVHQVKIGEICLLRNIGSQETVPAEVVGFKGSTVFLAPIGNLHGISTTTEVIPTGETLSLNIGDDLKGCILDGLGTVIDYISENTPSLNQRYRLTNPPPDPLRRKTINIPLATGVCAIDGMLTIGEGQRVGIFAGAGVGKSTLISMLVKKTDVDSSGWSNR